MKVTIDQNGCISCTLCAELCPDAFKMNDNNIAEVFKDPIPKEAEQRAVNAMESCPVSVISITK